MGDNPSREVPHETLTRDAGVPSREEHAPALLARVAAASSPEFIEHMKAQSARLVRACLDDPTWLGFDWVSREFTDEDRAEARRLVGCE